MIIKKIEINEVEPMEIDGIDNIPMDIEITSSIQSENDLENSSIIRQFNSKNDSNKMKRLSANFNRLSIDGNLLNINNESNTLHTNILFGSFSQS